MRKKCYEFKAFKSNIKSTKDYIEEGKRTELLIELRALELRKQNEGKKENKKTV